MNSPQIDSFWRLVLERMTQPVSGHAIESLLLEHERWILAEMVHRKWQQPIAKSTIPPKTLQNEVDRYGELWYRILNLTQATFTLSRQGYAHPGQWFIECWLEGDLFSRWSNAEAKNDFMRRIQNQNQQLAQCKNPFMATLSPHTDRLIGATLKYKPWLTRPYQAMVNERKTLVKYFRRNQPQLFQADSATTAKTLGFGINQSTKKPRFKSIR